ncbi:MAG: hypothetical protein ACOYK8_08630 [Alphaproteobacteria bacterium]
MSVSAIQNIGITAVQPTANQYPKNAASEKADSSTGVAYVKYFSPVLNIDRESNTVLLQYRDASTGDVKAQYPSESQLKAYTEQQRLQKQAEEKQADAALLKAETQPTTNAGNSQPNVTTAKEIKTAPVAVFVPYSAGENTGTTAKKSDKPVVVVSNDKSINKTV